MPLFIDRHDNLVLPQEAIQQMVADIKAGKRYEDGVMLVNGYANQQGTAFCLTDAPDASAVRKHHEAVGIPCGEVIQVQSMA